MSLGLAGCGCSSQPVVRHCAMDTGSAKVMITLQAPKARADLSSLEIAMTYPVEEIARLTALSVTKDKDRVEEELKKALAAQLGVSQEDLGIEWNDSKLTLRGRTSKPEALLVSLNARPASLRFEDVLMAMEDEPELYCD